MGQDVIGQAMDLGEPLAIPLPPSLAAQAQGEIAVLRLSRPEKRNALDDDTILGIEIFFEALPDTAKAVVIHGEGEHFSAGLDLSELTERDIVEGIAHSRMWHRVFDAIQYGRVPVVAVMHGAVIGGGLELAAAAHVRVAERSTFYALPEGQRGIFVGGGGSVRIQRLMGYARMADLMLTGRVLTAEEGERANLCQYVVPAGESLARAKSLAARIAENAPLTNWAVCSCLPRVNDMSHDDGLFIEGLIGNAVASTEGYDRVKQFVDKQAKRLVKPGTSGDGR